MQSPILRPSLLWGCLLLLVFTAIRVGATVEEGTILRNWAMNNNFSTPASWNNGSNDPCGIDANWRGVSCGNSSNVLSIDLQNSNLEGSLVPTLGQLSLLTSLRLDNNLFSGSIPQAIGNLSALTTLTLSGNILTGPVPASLGNLTKLEYLNLDDNVLSGTIPQKLVNLPALSNLILRRNRLSGPIPEFGSSNLENLDLSFNNLTGSYPESLARLPSLSTINLDGNSISGDLDATRILDLLNTTAATYNLPSKNQSVSLVNNIISGVIYLASDSLQIRSRVAFKLQGNLYCGNLTDALTDFERCLCQQAFVCYLPDYPKSAPPARRRIIIGTLIGLICGAVILLLAIICGVIAIVKRLAKRKLCELEEEYKHKFAEFEVNPQPFLFKVIRNATLDFNESTKLGQGGFGTVYKGILSNGNEIAIKKLEPKLAAQGDVDDFLNEVVFITKMRHPNLVNLKGYCIRGKERMLVYEYVENMDVEQSLLAGKNKEAMTWPVRFNICLGVAQGLHYLHVAMPRVIHRDIKASNILLGAQYEPKIGDFGLALLFPDNETHISMATIAGTKGYLAPEYASYGQLSEKADIYSFGILCLEIISGRKNIDPSKPTNQVYLASWAWTLYEEKNLKDLIDQSLHLRIDEEEKALRLIQISLSCLQQIPQRRPSMNDIQIALRGNMKIDEIEPFTMKEFVNFDVILEESSLLNSLSIKDNGGNGSNNLYKERQ